MPNTVLDVGSVKELNQLADIGVSADILIYAFHPNKTLDFSQIPALLDRVENCSVIFTLENPNEYNLHVDIADGWPSQLQYEF
jgi:hypothetical protein